MPLAEYLSKTGESQRDFARRAGLKQPSVCRWAKGKARPNRKAAEKIAIATEGEIPMETWGFQKVSKTGEKV